MKKLTLRELRHKKGVSIGQMAKELSLDKSTISYYETGKRWPNDENKQKLADYFGFKVGEYFFNDGKDK